MKKLMAALILGASMHIVNFNPVKAADGPPSSDIASMVTVIGSITTDFIQYGLQEKAFRWEECAAMSAECEESLASHIDKSRLIIFAAATPANVFAKIFMSERIVNSLRKFLERGGVLYFDPLYYDTLNRVPLSMTSFFKDIAAYLQKPSNYNAEANNYKGIPNPAFKHSFTSTPNDLSDTRQLAEFSFVNNIPETCHVLMIDRKTDVPLVIIQEGILGKGKIINSYIYSFTRAEQCPFFENIVKATARTDKAAD